MSNKKKNGMRRALTTVSILLGLVLAVLLGITVYAEYLLNKVNYVDPDATVPTLSQEQVEVVEQETEAADLEFTGPEMNEEDVVLETAPVLDVSSADVVNILLIGVDQRKNEPARSDSMIPSTSIPRPLHCLPLCGICMYGSPDIKATVSMLPITWGV